MLSSGLLEAPETMAIYSITMFNPLARVQAPNGSIAVPPGFARAISIEQKNTRIPLGLQFFNTRRLHTLKVSGGTLDQSPAEGTHSPSDMVKRLYTCINSKNMKGLQEIMSEDCCIDDFSFSKPFEGKKVWLALHLPHLHFSRTTCSLQVKTNECRRS